KVRRAVLGINIDEVEPNDAKVAGLSEIKGVKVSGFDPKEDPESSPAKKAGMEVGDIIISAGGQPVDKVSALQRVIRNYKPNEVVPIEAMRFGEKKSFRVKLGEPQAEAATEVAERPDAEPISNSNERSYDKLGISVGPVTNQVPVNQVPQPYR